MRLNRYRQVNTASPSITCLCLKENRVGEIVEDDSSGDAEELYEDPDKVSPQLPQLQTRDPDRNHPPCVIAKNDKKPNSRESF